MSLWSKIDEALIMKYGLYCKKEWLAEVISNQDYSNQVNVKKS